MSRGAHALLAGLVDYAGLFPPAALDLGPAAQNYGRYRTGPDAWMLGRFIVPASRLADLDAHVGALGEGAPLSVLGLPHDGDWLEAAVETLHQARAFEDRHDGTVVCDRFEIKLPAALAADADRLADVLNDLDARYRDRGDAGPRAALEVPFRTDPETVGPAAQAVADANGRADRPAFALKLRCGGVTADLVPSVEAVATAITEVRQAGAPFKATAGLHHPLPNADEAVGARMLGFLGVFGGAALARLHGLGADDLAEILDDADASHWSLDDDGLAWTSLRISPAELAGARDQLALSFGSCSFDEPRDDLRQLSWLPARG